RGSSPPLAVMSTLTWSCPARRSAQSSAASAGPMMSRSPADLNSTAGAGSGSGNAAIATSAAIFGVTSAACPLQPPSSRTFTNLTFACERACSASSPKRAASCVQATSTSVSLSTAWNAPASLRQSWSCTASAAPPFSALASAFASIPMVRLQLQTLSVLPSRLIRLRFPLVFLGNHRLVGRLLFLLVEEHRARLVQRREQLFGYRLAHRPVAGERLERIRHVEMRIAEELLQRESPQLILHLRIHERREVRVGRELVERWHRRRRCLLLLGRGRFALQPRPAREKRFLFVALHFRRLFAPLHFTLIASHLYAILRMLEGARLDAFPRLRPIVLLDVFADPGVNLGRHGHAVDRMAGVEPARRLVAADRHFHRQRVVAFHAPEHEDARIGGDHVLVVALDLVAMQLE